MEGMVIWAKLTQGNGRGTCCWSKHNFKIEFLDEKKIIRCAALRGYLDIKLLIVA